jgi:molybdopterin molybdotransferase
MISVSEAQLQILASIPSPVPPEVIAVADALGRVLAEDVRSTTDVPPADNSAVDGYAVAAADIPRAGTCSLDVVADLPAGALFAGRLTRGHALRIMTGAPIPAGADTVYPQEAVTRGGPRIEIPPIDPGANVRYQGEDVRAGEVVLSAGSVVRAQEMGVAASLGLARLLVRQRPRVAVLSTGDEVAEPGGARGPAQIYDANRFTLRGLVEACGAAVTDCGIIPDRFDDLRTQLLAAAGSHDVVLTSGGVSVGDHDLVKGVLQDTGRIDFWQVAMQPGRPVAVGRIRDAHFFGLPGNPVATMLTFHLFVRPALWKLAGRTQLDVPRFRAVAVEGMRKKRGRREFKRGLLTYRDPHWEVTTTGPQGSGILTSMTQANCLIILEEPAGDVAPGDPVWVEPFSGA